MAKTANSRRKPPTAAAPAAGGAPDSSVVKAPRAQTTGIGEDLLPQDDLTISLTRADIADGLPFAAPDLSKFTAVERANKAFELARRFSDEAAKEGATARRHAGAALTCRTASLVTTVLQVRDGDVAPAVEEALRARGWTVQSEKPFKKTICAVDGLDPTDRNASSLADQRAAACDTISRLIEAKEAELGRGFELTHADIEEAVRLVKNHGQPSDLGGSQYRDNVTVPPDRSVEISLDTAKLKARRMTLGRAQLARQMDPDGSVNPDEIVLDDGVYARVVSADGRTELVQLALDGASVDEQVRRSAKPHPSVQFLADLFRLGRDCVPESKEVVSGVAGVEHSGDEEGMRVGTRQLHMLSGKTFVYSPILQGMSLVVEAEAREDVARALVPATFGGDCWVNAAGHKPFSEQLIGSGREIAFDLHHYERGKREPGKWALRWALGTDCGKADDAIGKTVVLSPVVARPGRTPIDVRRPEFLRHAEAGRIVQARIDREAFAGHAGGAARSLVKPGKNGPVALSLKVASDKLVLDPQDLKLELRLRERAGREGAFARVLRTDWGRACVALGKLSARMTDDVLLELDPAGVLRLTARTGEGRFAVWMFLLRPKGDERTDAMLAPEMFPTPPAGDEGQQG